MNKALAWFWYLLAVANFVSSVLLALMRDYRVGCTAMMFTLCLALAVHYANKGDA